MREVAWSQSMKDKRAPSEGARALFSAGLSLRITDAKALLFHEGDSGLLHFVKRIYQCTLAIGRIGEIITKISVNLIDSRPPLEIDIHMCRLLLEELAEVLIPKEWVGAVLERRI